MLRITLMSSAATLAVLFAIAVSTTIQAQAELPVYLPNLRDSGEMPVCDTLKGIIADSRTLYAGCVYAIQGNVLIAERSRLTIEPRVTLRFDGNYYLAVDGAILANGLPNAPIHFTSGSKTPQRADWANLIFRGTSVPSELAHVIVEYGGNSSYIGRAVAIQVEERAALQVEQSVIQANVLGIGGSGIVTVSHTMIAENYAGINFEQTGRVSIYSSTFAYNGPAATLAAFGLASLEVYSSTVLHNQARSTTPVILLDHGDILQGTVIASNAVRNGSAVLDAREGAAVVNNLFCDNVPHNDTPPYPESSKAVISIYEDDASTVLFSNNNIQLPDDGYAVSLLKSRTNVFDGTGNYWFTTDAEKISAHIYDYYDDPLRLQEFQFIPIRTVPVHTAPVVCPK